MLDMISIYVNKLENVEEMGKFLEKCNLPKLNQAESENLKRPITTNEVETVIKKTLKKQKP